MSVVLNTLTKPPPSSKRIKDAALAYGKRHWEDLLKPGFMLEYPGCTPEDPKFLSNIRDYKKRRFDELSEEEEEGGEERGVEL